MSRILEKPFEREKESGRIERHRVEKTAFERTHHLGGRERENIKILWRHAEFFQGDDQRHVIGRAQASGHTDFFAFEIL
jgi:hypothetical protein